MELIDKEKLLKWLEVELDLSSGKSEVEKADRWAYGQVKKDIESGTFDDHSAQKEIAKLKEERDIWKSDYGTAQQEIARIEEERNALLEVLKWYADDEKWEKHYGNIAAVDFDKGERARSVIAKYEENKEVRS